MRQLKKQVGIVVALAALSAGAAGDKGKWPAERIEVKSTLDGTLQPAWFWAPEKAKDEPVPLVVGHHSWSTDIRDLVNYRAPLNAAMTNGWVFVGPSFRGPNRRPEACGSDLAVQDIVDAIEWAKAHAKVDPKRIYIIGPSGGGHMALLMLGRHPEIFAAGVALCPITDIARWHADSLLKHPGRSADYARDIEGACGGKPEERPEEYARRSPLTWLQRTREAKVPVYICTGIHDGWKGSVPVGHAIRAFNVLADEKDRISEADIAFIEANQRTPPGFACGDLADPFYAKRPVHLRRTSANARLTLFEGAHQGNYPAAFDFLRRQVKGRPADWTLPEAGRGAVENIAK